MGLTVLHITAFRLITVGKLYSYIQIELITNSVFYCLRTGFVQQRVK